MTSDAIVAWLLVLSPLIAGSTIYFLKSEPIVEKIDQLDAWLVEKYATTHGKDGKFQTYVIQPLLWALTRVMTKTEHMPDAFLRSGIRIAAYGYITAFALYLLYFAVVVVLTIVAFFVICYLIAEFSGNDSGHRSSSERVPSREREGFFGDKYTEHENDGGEVVGVSREREGFLGGKYTEHTNDKGEVVGKSHEREGFFGDKYTEHTNSNGEAAGESHAREGFFGDKYTEHTNSNGEAAGETRAREGFFGDKYTETKKR